MDELVEIFLKLPMKTVQVHLIIGMTLDLINNVAFAWIEPPTLWSQVKHETSKLQNQDEKLSIE